LGGAFGRLTWTIIVDDVPARVTPPERPNEAEELLDDFLIALLKLPGWSGPADAALGPMSPLRCRRAVRSLSRLIGARLCD